MESDHRIITVRGIVERGHGVASGAATDSPYPRGTITMQKPYFAARGLDLDTCYDGTLNISIAPHTFVLRRPRYTFRQVRWTSLHPPEDFSFSPCRLVVGGESYDGWIYYPHPETKRDHFQNPSIIEILAPFIPTLHYGDQVEVMIDGNQVTLR
jgi:hypothetical protein